MTPGFAAVAARPADAAGPGQPVTALIRAKFRAHRVSGVGRERKGSFWTHSTEKRTLRPAGCCGSYRPFADIEPQAASERESFKAAADHVGWASAHQRKPVQTMG